MSTVVTDGSSRSTGESIMSRVLTLLAILTPLTACITVPTMTEGDHAQLATAMQSPLTFELGKDESAAAWGRAQVFVFKHSHIKTASDFVIDAGRCPRYTAERLPLGENRFRIAVAGEDCGQGPKSKDDQARDLHVFAHFVRTGELVCSRDGVSACASPRETEFSFEGPKVKGGQPSPVLLSPAPVIVR